VVAPTAATTHNYQVTGTDANGCKATASAQITVESCVGLSEMEGGSVLKVYPNPSTGEFTVEGNAGVRIQVINAIGQVVQTVELNETNGNKAMVSGLSPGVYFVRSAETQEVLNKIIINK
jgi:hypothetical protein